MAVPIFVKAALPVPAKPNKNATQHIKEHNKFKGKIVELREKFKNNELEISFELIDFLEDWLLDHLMTQDQKYVKCFKEHGLK